MAPIQAYCDQHLNLGDADERGFIYRPASLWPYAALVIINYPKMISSDPDPEAKDIQGTPFPDRGFMTQKEAFVVFPLLRSGAPLEKALLNTTVEWALPFIVVENPMSAICGREMLGIPKFLGKIEIGEGKYPDSFRARVGIPGWPSLEPEEMQHPDLTFLEVETFPALPTFRGGPDETSLWTLLRSGTAGKTIGALGTLNEFVESISLGLYSFALRTVHLRQFRDAADPSKALYQALVSCRSTYSSINNFKFYNESDVDIKFNDRGSFSPILDVFLGARAEASGTVRAPQLRAAYRFDGNIDFDHTRTLHTFPVDRGVGLPPIKETDDMLAPWFRPIRGFFSERGS
jgi:hypothetical protein